jgi:ABC-type transport system substrate-binding protein
MWGLSSASTPKFLTYLEMWSRGPTPDVAGMQLASGRPYDHRVARVLHSENETPVGWNNGRVKDPEMDALLDQATTEPDPVKAAEIWKKAVRRAAEEAHVLTVVHDLMPVVLSPKVKGFKFPHLAWFSFRETWQAP